MQLRIGYELAFEVPAPTTILCMLRVRPENEPALLRPEAPKVDSADRVREYIDGFGNRVDRLDVPAGTLRLTNEAIIEVDPRPDPVTPDAVQHDVSELPDDALVYLLSSRYCEVDRLGDVAWDLFGNGPRGWGRVKAVCNWVHNHLTFDYQSARPTKTAADAYDEKRGVCRDFTHLAITFCRCLNIPARYSTGYLGDIGVPPSRDAMDFSAWFEVFLGGRWHTFDARHNIPRIGRVVMARGRDAVDCALTTSFGPATLTTFIVHTEEADAPRAASVDASDRAHGLGDAEGIVQNPR